MRGVSFSLLSLALLFACDKKAERTPEATKARETEVAERASAELGRATASAAPRGGPSGTHAADELSLPPAIGKPPIPADNPQTDAKVALGRQLFFDARLSGDGSLSCYSCHRNENGTGGKDPIAVGPRQKRLNRHSPTLWNVGHLPRLFWDGRSASLEELSKAALGGPAMGLEPGQLAKKAGELAKIPGYRQGFAEAFPGAGPTAETLTQALAAYQRSIECTDTDYDRFAAGTRDALNLAQKDGLALFMGKAGCVACHTPPHFSSAFLVRDGVYFNVGVGFETKKPSEPNAASEVDLGRKTVTSSDADFGAFKVPSLRGVTRSAPYFHDGSEPELERAVRYMASAGHANPRLSALMSDKKLTDEEIGKIVAFLGALECKTPLSEPKLP